MDEEEEDIFAQIAEYQCAERKYFDAKMVLRRMLDMGRMLECPAPSARREAVNAVLRETGVDLRPMLALAAAAGEQWLSLSALRSELGVTSDDAMNEILGSLDLQRQIGGLWVPGKFSKGLFWRMVSQPDEEPPYNGVQWNLAEVRALLEETDSAEDDDDAI